MNSKVERLLFGEHTEHRIVVDMFTSDCRMSVSSIHLSPESLRLRPIMPSFPCPALQAVRERFCPLCIASYREVFGGLVRCQDIVSTRLGT
jgi:hypothetical protein